MPGSPVKPTRAARVKKSVFDVSPEARRRAASSAKRKNTMERLLDVWEGKRTTHRLKGQHE